MSNTIQVIVGTQFGSEGKGAVTGYTIQELINQGGNDGSHNIISVRVGGPNAGHCVLDPATGHKYAFRTVPVGAAISDSIVNYIAAGSEVDLNVLANEVHELINNGRRPYLVISGQATLLEPRHIEEEKNSDLNKRTGSTSKGIGAARADRIWRKALTINQAMQDSVYNTEVAELKAALHNVGGALMIDSDNDLLQWSLNDNAVVTHIVIEGTQGYGLGLHAGLYPQCTSNNARAIDFLAMAGVSPWAKDTTINVIGATRTNPIRVAGNSGPLKGETTWEELGQASERTTVTQKIRRVGEWDGELVYRAVQDGAVTHLALTMVDKTIPEAAELVEHDHTIRHITRNELIAANPEVASLVERVEIEAGCPVLMLGVGESRALIITDK